MTPAATARTSAEEAELVTDRPGDLGAQKLFLGPENYSLYEFAAQNLS
jgi:hypothetical protein